MRGKSEAVTESECDHFVFRVTTDGDEWVRECLGCPYEFARGDTILEVTPDV